MAGESGETGEVSGREETAAFKERVVSMLKMIMVTTVPLLGPNDLHLPVLVLL